MAWVLAVLLVLGSIVALLLARWLVGPRATRIVGGVLVLVGLGAVLRHFVTYWLPAAEVYVPALLVLAALGLVAVLTGGQAGLAWGGLSAASGLLAVGLVVAESSHVPGIGSYQRDMLNVAATSLGFVAVAAALGAAGRGGSRVVGLAGATLAAIGMVVTAVAAYRLYPVYGDAGEQPTMIAIAGVAVLALLVLAAVLARKAAQVAPRDVRGSELRPVPPSRQPEPAPSPQLSKSPAPPVVQQPASQPQPQVPHSGTTASIARPVAAAPARSRLEAIATLIGLVTGIIALVRELVNLLRWLSG